MSSLVKLLLFSLLFSGHLYAQESPLLLTLPSLKTEAQVCITCQATPNSYNLPDLGEPSAHAIEQIKLDLAELIKSRKGTEITASDVAQTIMKGPTDSLKKSLQADLPDFSIKMFVKSGDARDVAANTNYVEQVRAFFEDPKNDLQNPNGRLRGKITTRGLGLKYQSSSALLESSGIAYSLSADQSFRLSGGAIVKANIIKTIGRESNIRGNVSISDNGQKSLTVSYELHFK